jgi:DNA topoisomerase IB
MRLRRSDCAEPGLRRVRHGRGFRYVEETGGGVDGPTLERIRDLAIPPAWRDVWICADPWGHLQATGIDRAGRKQYRYHDAWRQRRDRQKFRRMLDFGGALPRLRLEVAHDLAARGLGRDRVLACAVRLLDVGLFRVGGEEYADEGGLGLATLSKRHVIVRRGVLRFDYPAKSGVRRMQEVDDPACAAVIGRLRNREGGGRRLLAYRDQRRWVSVHADDINGYIKQRIGDDFSAKDFRTWNATVLTAVSLAADGRDADTKRARKRAIDGAIKGVAEVLGNTPAVARRSYIDPRVFDRYLSGWTIGGEVDRIGSLTGPDDRRRGRLERAVLDLLHDDRGSRAVTHDVGRNGR